MPSWKASGLLFVTLEYKNKDTEEKRCEEFWWDRMERTVGQLGNLIGAWGLSGCANISKSNFVATSAHCLPDLLWSLTAHSRSPVLLLCGSLHLCTHFNHSPAKVSQNTQCLYRCPRLSYQRTSKTVASNTNLHSHSFGVWVLQRWCQWGHIPSRG